MSSLAAGIVGLPNVGKSTIFNALCAGGAESANYPFCTIDPNVGIVVVPDSRLDRIAELAKSKEIVPADVRIVDIAGLVQGASKGEGLGNQFLANIRETDAILHVVRCFDDPNVVHVEGSVDPARDIEIIETELLLADLDSLQKRHDRVAKMARVGNKDAANEAAVLQRAVDAASEGTPIRAIDWTDEERRILRESNLLTIKPVLFVANVAEKDLDEESEHLATVRRIADEKGGGLVVISGEIESQIAQLEPEERREFLNDLGLEEPGLNALIRAAYEILSLQTFFTAGPKEARAWTIRKGTRAPQAAGRIHSDFERGFIRAETISFADYIQEGGEQGAKAKGRMRSEGKDYIVNDGDVILFRFNV
ncbi:MAG: redox-regulated ATPase YchF [Acidobacteria bacterium]|nr:redox-regulated ATPase YchF [Acidobacteriota bacterium]